MRALLLFLAFSLSFLPLPTAANDVVTLVADEWCPYNCVPGTKNEGYVLDIARRVYGDAGLDVAYLALPWTRALHEVSQGRYAAVIGTTRAEAPSLIFPQEECGLSDNGFFVRTDADWRYKGIRSFESMRMALIRDYDYGDAIKNYRLNRPGASQIHVAVECDALNRNLHLLEKNRVDLVVEDINVGKYTVHKLGLQDKIKFAGPEGKPIPVYVAFSPSAPEALKLARIFTEGIRRLRASGELSIILERYGLSDWK